MTFLLDGAPHHRERPETPENEGGTTLSDHPNETDRSAERVLRVGVIGLGDIGRGVAGSLALANVDLSVCDVRAEAMEPFADSARLVERPAQLVDHCDVIFVAVINDAQVRAVVTEPGGVLDGAAGGTSVIILSTITTTTLLDVAAIAAQSDVAVVDCGVSGGPTAAASGELDLHGRWRSRQGRRGQART